MVHKENGGVREICAAAPNKGQHYDEVCWRVARGRGVWSVGSKGGGEGVEFRFKRNRTGSPAQTPDACGEGGDDASSTCAARTTETVPIKPCYNCHRPPPNPAPKRGPRVPGRRGPAQIDVEVTVTIWSSCHGRE